MTWIFHLKASTSYWKICLERSGYHPALAKVDSAPSASVGMHGINTGLCGQTSAIHANSEASLLKIHHNKHDSTAASIMVWFKENITVFYQEWIKKISALSRL